MTTRARLAFLAIRNYISPTCYARLNLCPTSDTAIIQSLFTQVLNVRNLSIELQGSLTLPAVFSTPALRNCTVLRLPGVPSRFPRSELLNWFFERQSRHLIISTFRQEEWNNYCLKLLDDMIEVLFFFRFGDSTRDLVQSFRLLRLANECQGPGAQYFQRWDTGRYQTTHRREFTIVRGTVSTSQSPTCRYVERIGTKPKS